MKVAAITIITMPRAITDFTTPIPRVADTRTDGKPRLISEAEWVAGDGGSITGEPTPLPAHRHPSHNEARGHELSESDLMIAPTLLNDWMLGVEVMSGLMRTHAQPSTPTP